MSFHKKPLQTPSLPSVSILIIMIIHMSCIQIMHSRNVLRAHFALTQVLLSILDPLTSNSSLSLVSLNQHPVFPVIFKSNCCWQNPLKAGCSPLLTVKVQLLLFRGQVILEPALKILCSILFRSCMNLLLNLFIPGSGHT